MLLKARKMADTTVLLAGTSERRNRLVIDLFVGVYEGASEIYYRDGGVPNLEHLGTGQCGRPCICSALNAYWVSYRFYYLRRNHIQGFRFGCWTKRAVDGVEDGHYYCLPGSSERENRFTA